MEKIELKDRLNDEGDEKRMTPVKLHIEGMINASRELQNVAEVTPLQKSEHLSERYDCNVYLKREDLQVVRSFKIRGAYHAMVSLPAEARERGVVCASAGNHAQGVAYSCKRLGITGYIFMPTTTPRQKISQVKRYGDQWIEIILTGDTFDDSFREAKRYCEEKGLTFIHPFDDVKTIEGQATVGVEILQQMSEPIDYVFVSIGGGGLISGIGSYIKMISPNTSIIGVEPEGAPSMYTSLKNGSIVTLEEMDHFVDGSAVRRVGELTFNLCKELVDDVLLVPEGKACTTILELYNDSAIVLEPAGALPISALDLYREQIRGKTVVCVVSGGNNDIDRMQEIKERSMIYEGLKHYFLINFPQRAGALREFLDNVLGPEDDITRFEYTKRNNRDEGPALVGIELKHRDDYDALIKRLSESDYTYVEVNNNPLLFNMLV